MQSETDYWWHRFEYSVIRYSVQKYGNKSNDIYLFMGFPLASWYLPSISLMYEYYKENSLGNYKFDDKPNWSKNWNCQLQTSTSKMFIWHKP